MKCACVSYDITSDGAVSFLQAGNSRRRQSDHLTSDPPTSSKTVHSSSHNRSLNFQAIRVNQPSSLFLYALEKVCPRRGVKERARTISLNIFGGEIINLCVYINIYTLEDFFTIFSFSFINNLRSVIQNMHSFIKIDLHVRINTK